MTKIMIQTLVFVLASGTATSLAKPSRKKAEKNLEPQAIVEAADRARFPAGDISFYVDVMDKANGKTTAQTKYKVLAKGKTATLVETIEPDRLRGRKLLMTDDNLWFYTPDIKRPTRVSLQQRLTGEVANGDLARTNFADDYVPTLARVEKFKKRDTYVLKLKAKEGKNVTYGAVELWVDKQKLNPVKAHFFAVSGKLLKVGNYLNFKKDADGLRPYLMIIEDAVNKTRRSELRYRDIKKEELSDSIFNKESMS